jgi:hypothetical protein
MLEVVLQQAGGNQTLAAEMLGINRNTLRKKLTEHKLLLSCRKSEQPLPETFSDPPIFACMTDPVKKDPS